MIHFKSLLLSLVTLTLVSMSTATVFIEVSVVVDDIESDTFKALIYMENTVPVAGFQFNLVDNPELLTVTGASGGSADATGFMLSTNPDGLVLGFSLTAATIPVGSNLLLTQVTFTDFEGSSICFGEDTGPAGSAVISDGSGGYVGANWGECYELLLTCDFSDDGEILVWNPTASAVPPDAPVTVTPGSLN